MKQTKIERAIWHKKIKDDYKITLNAQKTAIKYGCSRELVRQLMLKEGIKLRVYVSELMPKKIHLPKKPCHIRCQSCLQFFTKKSPVFAMGRHQRCYRNWYYHNNPKDKEGRRKYYWKNQKMYSKANKNLYYRRSRRAEIHYFISYLLYVCLKLS